MAITIVAAGKNAMLDAIATFWGAGALLRLYSGTAPTDVNTALSGNNVLAVVTPTPAAASAGSKDMLGGTKSTTGTASAGSGVVATFYRVYASDGTTVKEQGSITVTGGGGDLTLTNTNIAQNQPVDITSFTKSFP